jgi:diguanylate cyclase (GGDEF)-like protein/PAS domain S-box-containing protein
MSAEDPAELKRSLEAATASATDAYRQSARLIRVLGVLGVPSSPTELVDEILVVLSQMFAADVVVIGRVVGAQVEVTGACGLAENDPVLVTGWPLEGAAAEAMQLVRPVARCNGDLAPEDIPTELRPLLPRSAVWVPVGDQPGSADELLMLFRRAEGGFDQTDLHVLGSVASRLRLAIVARERTATVERLADCAHRLTSHLDVESLLQEAVDLLPTLVDADGAAVVTTAGGAASLGAWAGVEGPVASWPMAVSKLWSADEVMAGGTFTTEWEGPHGHGQLLGVPVGRDDRPGALLYAFRHGSRPFRADDLDAATAFGTYLGVAMTNARLYEALGESESSLRLITDSISDLVAVVDPAGRYLYASPSHERELGRLPEELVGESVMTFVHPADRAGVRASIADPTAIPKVEYRLRTGAGDWVWVESALRLAPIVEDAVVLSSRVIEDRRRLEAELRRQATHDPLTGLANRALTTEWLEAALTSGRGGYVGTLFCDLDEFKEVNDRLGHEAGDELLVHVADRLRECVRRGDLLSRFGGDEFVVVLDDVADTAALTEVGARMVQALENPFMLRGERVQISASVGGVLGRRARTSASAMLRDADAAMYAAKELGRGRVEVFDEAASLRSRDRLEVSSHLVEALGRGELLLHYQPIVELIGERVIGFEALARWKHPTRGFIPPDVFIPIAEESGAIVEIGEWVLGQASRQLASWRRAIGGDAMRMNVNLSALQLEQPDAAGRAIRIIRDSGADPGDVWLEVTEQRSIRTDVSEFADAMRAVGVHFALDDFGMSYSNLGHLERLPVELLKIDRSFVIGLTSTDTDRGIVRAVLAIADSLGLSVVAEGIETVEQRDALIGLGCDHGQGYLFSRPMPAEVVDGMLDALVGRVPLLP